LLATILPHGSVVIGSIRIYKNRYEAQIGGVILNH